MQVDAAPGPQSDGVAACVHLHCILHLPFCMMRLPSLRSTVTVDTQAVDSLSNYVQVAWSVDVDYHQEVKSQNRQSRQREDPNHSDGGATSKESGMEISFPSTKGDAEEILGS